MAVQTKGSLEENLQGEPQQSTAEYCRFAVVRRKIEPGIPSHFPRHQPIMEEAEITPPQYELAIRRGNQVMYLVLAWDDYFMTTNGMWETPWTSLVHTKIGYCLEAESFLIQKSATFDPMYDGRVPLGMCRSILFLPIESIKMIVKPT